MEISREKFGEWSNTCPNKKEKKNDGQKKRTGNAFSFFFSHSDGQFNGMAFRLNIIYSFNAEWIDKLYV